MDTICLAPTRVRKVAEFRCVICEEKWPVNFLTAQGDQHLCCICRKKLKDEAFHRRNSHLITSFQIAPPTARKSKLVRWCFVAVSLVGGLVYGGFALAGTAKNDRLSSSPAEILRAVRNAGM